jgi:hypothetical protein
MADSVFAAVVDRYNSLTDVPDLYQFDAPVSADAVQVYPPYSVILDEGTQCVYEFEHTVMEVTSLTIMVYADTLALVDAAVERIKYNGGAIDGGLGLDFGTLPTLSVDFTNLEVRRLSEQHFLATTTGKLAQRVFGSKLEYRVTLYRTSS